MSIFIYWLSESSPSILKASEVGLLLTGLLLIALFFLAWRTLHQLPPSDFADITIGGESATQLLTSTSYEIWKICHEFQNNKNMKYLENLMKKGGEEFPISKRNREKIQITINRLHNLVLMQQSQARRIFAMKHLVSDELGIPVRRLCDHVFQFSPEMHQRKTSKVVRNFEEILSHDEAFASSDVLSRRRSALIGENIRILDKIDSIKYYQMQMIQFSDLHSHVAALASEHSTSGSARNYARALSEVVRGTLDQSSAFVLGRYEDFSLCLEKLRFLYFKQRAHPGFDLHQTCICICKAVQRFKKETDDRRENRRERFKRFERMTDVLERFARVPKDDPFKKKPEDIGAIKKFGEDIDWFIEICRKRIVSRFAQYFLEWENKKAPERKETLIVSHGYSKTVREVLKRGLEIYEKHKKKVPRVFLLDEGNERSFDTRLIVYELKESPLHTERHAISFGSGDLLSGLLKTNTRILLLVGAECFDKERRVVHSRGVYELEMLRRRMEDKELECHVVAVAESYKYHPDLLKIPEFYQHHLDQVFLYKGGFVERILSDRDMRELGGEKLD